MGFDALDFAQQFHLGVGCGLTGNLFAKVDEGEGIPLAVGKQVGAQLRIRPRFQECRSLVAHLRKSIVAPDSPEPIPGVPVIPLAAMDDAMEEAAIGVLDALSDGMGGVQAVVPEKNESADQITVVGRQIGSGEEAFQGLVQLIMRQDGLARPRPQFGQTADCQQVPKFLKVGSHCHGSNLRWVGGSFK
ncbi:MAG: hypothetical protein JWR69_1686 [Pedosphaera sp.]|nr:hypothetical protein [Pedosphaera sp.]